MDNSIFEKAKRSFYWVVSSSIMFQIINWGITILVVRLLTPEDYGMFGLLMIANSYLGPLTHWNMSSWYVWKDELEENEERTVEFSILIFSFLVTTVVFLFSNYFAIFFKHPELTYGFRIISVLFFINGINKISLMKYERGINFKPISILNVCLRLLQGVITLLFVINGFGYISLVYSMLITAFIQTVLLFKIQPPVILKDITRLGFKVDTFKESFAYGSNITLGMFLWIIYSTADNLVIGKLFGPEILGYYTLAFFFIDLPLSKLNEWVRPILHPYFSRLRGDMDSLNRVFLQLVFIYMIILMPILLGLYTVAPEFVHMVLGSEWQGAVTFFKLLSFVGLLRAFSDLIVPYLFALGYPQYGTYANAIAAIAMPLFFYFGSLYFGINGIYFTWFIIYPVVPIFMLYFFVKKSGVKLSSYLSCFIGPTVSSALMILFLYLFKSSAIYDANSILCFVGEIFFACFIYVASILIFFRSRVLDAKHVFQR